MNRKQHLQMSKGPAKPSTPATLSGAFVACAMALLAAAPAMAETITFDAMTPATYTSGVTLNASHFNLALVEGPGAAAIGAVGSTGVIATAGDPFACDIAACPSGASGNYLGILNDGALTVSLDNTLGRGFVLGGLDFAFLAPFVGLLDGSYGKLQLSGTGWGGASASALFDLPGQDAAGNFVFNRALMGNFGANIFTSLTINACVYNADMVCTNTLADPAFNQAQFAIDNLDLSVVPEPASGLLIALGLGALGLASRRRSNVAAPSTTPFAQGI